MKKRIFGIVVIVALIATASWNSHQSKNDVALTDLALVDVEALANGEWEDLYNCSCGLAWGSGCKRDNWGVDCATSGTSDCSTYNSSCS